MRFYSLVTSGNHGCTVQKLMIFLFLEVATKKRYCKIFESFIANSNFKIVNMKVLRSRDLMRMYSRYFVTKER